MNVAEPSWLLGRSWNAAVSGAGAAAATATVASLVRDSSLSASSVKVTLTWMVLPCSVLVSRYLVPVAPLMAEPAANHWYW